MKRFETLGDTNGPGAESIVCGWEADASTSGLLGLAVLVAVAVVAVPKVAIMFAVPMMIVFTPAMVAVPVSFEKTLSIMVRLDPNCPCVGRTGPVPGVPPVVISHRKPVTLYPNKFRAWTWR
jgi:hypothetical protein